MTLAEYQAEYERLFRWRERWAMLSNKPGPRLESRQEAIERRARIANNRIGKLLQDYDRERAEAVKGESVMSSNESAEERARKAAEKIAQSVSETELDWAKLKLRYPKEPNVGGGLALAKITDIIAAEFTGVPSSDRGHDFGNINAPHPCSECGITVLDDHDGYDCVGWLQRCLNEVAALASSACSEGREAGLREAAEVADNYRVPTNAPISDLLATLQAQHTTAMSVAGEIRSLISQPAKQDGPQDKDDRG